MEKNNIPEEVTITPVIRDIERLFLRLLFLIKAILAFFVNLFAAVFKLCLKHFMVLALVMIIGALLGYFSNSFIPRNYTSNLVLEQSVDARAQLYNDISYVNSLIQKDEFESLSELLKITVEEAQTLSEMQVSPFSTQLEKLQMVDKLYKNLDTSTKRSLDITRFMEDEEGALSNRFAISIYGSDPKVFSKLEPSFIEFLERIPELQSRRMDSRRIFLEHKKLLMRQLSDLDTLKKVNNIRMLKEAEKFTSSPSTSISLGAEQSSESLNILEVYNRYNDYQSQIVSIENQLLNLESCYNVYAHFSQYGLNSGPGKLKRAALVGIALSVLTLIVLSIINNRSSSRESNNG